MILTAILVIVSCNIYNYSIIDSYYISDQERSQKYFDENTNQKFVLFESKLASIDVFKNAKSDLRLIVIPEWIKTDLAVAPIVSSYSFYSYIIKINNEFIFKDFLRIYPFHFFF